MYHNFHYLACLSHACNQALQQTLTHTHKHTIYIMLYCIALYMHLDQSESMRAARHMLFRPQMSRKNGFKLNNMICKENGKMYIVKGEPQAENPYHT